MNQGLVVAVTVATAMVWTTGMQGQGAAAPQVAAEPSGGPLAPDGPIAKGYNDAAKALAEVDDNPMIRWAYRVWCVTGYRFAREGDVMDAAIDPEDIVTPKGFLTSRGPDPMFGKFLDNAWYLGTQGTGVVIVKAPEGLLMFDSMSNAGQMETLIIPQMKTFGLNPADIIYIFFGHQHGDHIGGANLIRTKYAPGVRFVAGRPDADAIAASRTRIINGEAPPARGRGGRAPAPVPTTPEEIAAQMTARLSALPDRIDIQVEATPGSKNGLLQIAIGSTTVTAALVPGHTVGQTAFIVPVMWQGQPRKLAVWSGNDASVENTAQYATSIRFFQSVAAAEGADVHINTHGYQGKGAIFAKRVNDNPSGFNPFVMGKDGVQRFYGVFANCNAALARRYADGTWKAM